MRNYLLEKQISFSRNIECCREVIFDLRYLDITAYTGLAESTMISYDTRAVSPYITVAKKIADMYCTDIERLCGDEIYFDIEEVLSLQVAFIKPLGGIEIKAYKEKILAEIDKYLSLSKYEVYILLSKTFREIIHDLHRSDRYVDRKLNSISARQQAYVICCYKTCGFFRRDHKPNAFRKS